MKNVIFMPNCLKRSLLSQEQCKTLKVLQASSYPKDNNYSCLDESDVGLLFLVHSVAGSSNYDWRKVKNNRCLLQYMMAYMVSLCFRLLERGHCS